MIHKQSVYGLVAFTLNLIGEYCSTSKKQTLNKSKGETRKN